MAQFSKNVTNSEQQINTRCPEAILKAVPNNYKIVEFSELNVGENYNDKAIVGKVFRLNPIGKRSCGTSLRKILIADAISTEPDEQKKILPVFLFGKFADESEVAEKESYIILANFMVEESTRHGKNELLFQVLVNKDDSQILFARKLPPNKSKSPSKSNRCVKKKSSAHKATENAQVPAKKKKVVSDEENPTILSNNYEYVSLGDLQETEAKMSFNVYGIVEKCDLKVIQGKRTQLLDLMLTDETDTGFVCAVFGAKDEIYPDVYPGDIIRIHRMQVYKFRSRLKGKCPSPKFLLVFSKSNKGTRPKSVAKSFTFVSDDSERVKELFEWSEKKSETRPICEMKRGEYVNIVCQVIGVYCAKTTEAVILKIWDGTKTNELQSTHWGLKEENIDEKLFMIAKNFYVILSVYGPLASSTAGGLKPGQFVEVQDALLYSPKSNPDECKLQLQTGQKEGRCIKVLNDDDARVKDLKIRLEKIITDYLDIGNQTDDILNENNSLFLNCDISQVSSSQRAIQNNEEVISNEAVSSDVEALNRPINPSDEGPVSSQNKVISVVEASVRPGQCTQEFGSTQRECMEVDAAENEINSQIDLTLNKTPLEARMFLHNPPPQETPSFHPLENETEENWWKSVPTVSETDGYSDVKPSSLAEIIEHSVPHKFRCLAAVLSFKPKTQSIHDLIHLCCPNCMYMTSNATPSISPFEERDGLFYFKCPECSSSNEGDRPILRYTFVISLILMDETSPSSVEVHLWQDNAVQFFKGITPEEALKSKNVSDSIFQMLWNICPDCRPFDLKENNYTSYPILDCCVLSYQSLRGVCYQLFHTRLL